MEMKLAENIRLFRKHRRMTQEQLAEVLGVTVGAVHKWETSLSTPELNLIAEMADFFDVSVDVLLGYEMKDNRLKATAERLTQYIRDEDKLGLNEAEKALKRFPHSFDIVYPCAILFMIFGGKDHNEEQLRRASGLLEESLFLLPQNANPKISEIGIYAHMSNVQLMLGRGDQAAEFLKQHNREGIFNDQIGLVLSLFCRKPEEAQPFLSEALVATLNQTIQTVIGKAYAFVLCGDPDSAEKLLLWGLNLAEGLKQPETTGFLDSGCAFLYSILAYVYLKKDCFADAEKSMRKAFALAERFDAAPNYDARSFRFVGGAEEFSLHIMAGSTAKESVAYMISLIGDNALKALWREVSENES